MPLDQVENFVEVNVSGTHSSTETTISLQSGEVSNLPDPSSGEFNLVWFDSTNFSRPSEDNSVEIVRVTGRDITNDTVTVLRGQENTTAVAHDTPNSDYVMILAQTAKMIEDVDAADFSTNTVTVAGNSVALGSSTAVNHSDLSNIGTGDHHTRYSDEEAQDAVGGILNADFSYDDAGNSIALASNSLTVANTTIGLGGSGTPEADNLAGSNGSAGQVLQTDGSNTSWTDLESETVKTVSSDYTTSGETTIFAKTSATLNFLFTEATSDVTAPYDISYNNDGSKMYVVDEQSIKSFNLSTNYDFRTRTLNNTALSFNSSRVRCFIFNDDGTKAFLTNYGTQTIESYTLSTAYDISTLSPETSYDISSQTGQPRDLLFSNDARTIYLLGDSGDIYSYSLTSNYDLSTASFSSSINLSNTSSSNAFDFADNGNLLFVAPIFNREIDGYGLSTNYDALSTSFKSTLPYVFDDAGNFTGFQFVSGNFYVADSQKTEYHKVEFVKNNISVTLSSADVSKGKIVRVKDTGSIGSNSVTINTEGSETIDGSSSISLDTNYGVKQLQSDGTNWYIISDG